MPGETEPTEPTLQNPTDRRTNIQHIPPDACGTSEPPADGSLSWRLAGTLRRFGAGLVLLACSCWALPAAADDPQAGEMPRLSVPGLEPYRDLIPAGTSRAWHSASAAHLAMEQEAAGAQADGYRWRGPMNATPDWGGLGRDAVYFVSYQIVAIAVLYAAPEGFSAWTEEQKDSYSLEKWRENVSNPVWDSDKWYINYILHPYWGGTYYTRGRERGLSRTQSFWFSALLSTLYEYGPEALFEPVSIQDMIVTPVVGSLVGEYLFAPWRQRIRAKQGELDWSDKAVLVLTDPLGVINAQIDRWFGVKSTLTFQPIGMHMPAATRESLSQQGLPTMASRRHAAAWGLQLGFEW